jgi:hypothetical protein
MDHANVMKIMEAALVMNILDSVTRSAMAVRKLLLKIALNAWRTRNRYRVLVFAPQGLWGKRVRLLLEIVIRYVLVVMGRVQVTVLTVDPMPRKSMAPASVKRTTKVVPAQTTSAHVIVNE